MNRTGTSHGLCRTAGLTLWRLPDRSRGFTLVEVMAAFALFAIIFAVVLQILSTALSNTRSSAEFTDAALWAQSKLESVGVEEPLEPGRWTGSFNDTYDWELTVEPYMVSDERGIDPDDFPVSLYWVTLEIMWGDENRQREAVFDTLRAVDVHWEERMLEMQGR